MVSNKQIFVSRLRIPKIARIKDYLVVVVFVCICCPMNAGMIKLKLYIINQCTKNNKCLNESEGSKMNLLGDMAGEKEGD